MAPDITYMLRGANTTFPDTMSWIVEWDGTGRNERRKGGLDTEDDGSGKPEREQERGAMPATQIY